MPKVLWILLNNKENNNKSQLKINQLNIILLHTTILLKLKDTLFRSSMDM